MAIVLGLSRVASARLGFCSASWGESLMGEAKSTALSTRTVSSRTCKWAGGFDLVNGDYRNWGVNVAI